MAGGEIVGQARHALARCLAGRRLADGSGPRWSCRSRRRDRAARGAARPALSGRAAGGVRHRRGGCRQDRAGRALRRRRRAAPDRGRSPAASASSSSVPRKPTCPCWRQSAGWCARTKRPARCCVAMLRRGSRSSPGSSKRRIATGSGAICSAPPASACCARWRSSSRRSAPRSRSCSFSTTLHWSDPSTVDLLSLLAGRREPARLLVLGTYRPAELVLARHPLRAVSQRLAAMLQCAEVSLDDLGVEAVAEYLERRFAGSRFPAEVARLVARANRR